MTVVGFTISFHTAFRVGASAGRDGLHAAVDEIDPLPADHLKGLMRAAARDVLHLPAGRLDEVFGGRVRPCAWSWSSASPHGVDGDATGWHMATRYRVKRDPHSHAASKDHLVVAEQSWTPAARFTVTLRGILPVDEVAGQVLVLRAAGAAVHGQGGWRRRGLGWVGVRPDDPVTEADVAELLRWRTGPARREGS